MAVQHANTAVASTIMATVPILILLPEYFFLKRRITWEQVVGAVLSVGGVALFFL
jgi:drug/metabolite transporter (DMT)-like permease